MDSGYQMGEWKGKSKLQPVREFTVKALNVSTRRMLGRFLDHDTVCYSRSTGVQQDWQGLAELMGLDYSEIPSIGRKEERTVYLLDKWSMKSGTTIGQLLDFLEEQERYDVLEDDIFQRLITRDVDQYVRRQREIQRDTRLREPPVQVPEVDSVSVVPEPRMDYQSLMDEEFTGSTLNDRPGHPEFFDAFLCYTIKDIVFVKQVINQLEGTHGLKLCVPDRDVTPGSAKYTVLSHLIEKRCTKMVIIVSRNYLHSDEADFMTKFGHSLAPGARNKKLIPVLIEMDCPIPDILRFITLIDYTKCELVEWFWGRLAKALQESCVSMALLFSPHAVQEANEEAQAAKRRAFEQAMLTDSGEFTPYDFGASGGSVTTQSAPGGHMASSSSSSHLTLTGPLSNVSTMGLSGSQSSSRSQDSGYMVSPRSSPTFQRGFDEDGQGASSSGRRRTNGKKAKPKIEEPPPRKKDLF